MIQIILLLFLTQSIYGSIDINLDKYDVGDGSGSGPLIDGVFTEWSNFTECSASCNGGIQMRMRTCTNPAPQNGGADCVGETVQDRLCNTQICSVDGNWSPWTPYSACSASCNGGMQTRIRFCTNPKPEGNGKQCQGSNAEIRVCNTHECSVDGKWGHWSEYDKCTKSCDGGMQQRYRRCDSPAPKGKGKFCQGNNAQVRICNTNSCPEKPVIKSMTFCRNNRRTLRCENNRIIQISTVFWGRDSSNDQCKHWANTGSCKSDAALNIVKNKCNGKRSCSIMASKRELKSPGCLLWVRLTFQVTFMCIPVIKPTTSIPTTAIRTTDPTGHRQRFICDVSFIFCPDGYKITNIIAVYSNRLKNVCQVANPNINEGRCWRDVREEVKRECDNQMVCVVDKKRFPIFLGCPQTGYIEMLYQCIKQATDKPQTTKEISTMKPTTESKIKTKKVCEYRTAMVMCPGKVIDIKYAFMGRKESSSCKFSHGDRSNINCYTDATTHVKYSCQNKAFCVVNADPGFFGDPCPGTSKYLEIQYECVPKGTFPEPTKMNIPLVPLASPDPFVTQNPIFTECGRSYTQNSRVIGGQAPARGKLPWQVAIYRKGSFICGGSLINQKWIVTAAHCFSDTKTWDYEVVLGEHDRTVIEGQEERHKVKKIVKHYLYNNDFYPTIQNDNDIALVELKERATFSPFIAPICLPSQDYPVGQHCIVSGWGSTTYPGPMNGVLQYTELPIVNRTTCQDKLKIAPGKPGEDITTNMICAGESNRSSSGCHGDSGGPFACLSNNGKWELQGAVSWGSPRCHIKDMYMVVTNVRKYIYWIQQNIRKPVITDPTKPTTKSFETQTVPTTNDPITNVPTTNYPITNAPITNDPITNVPITNDPITNVPITNEPITNEPITNMPITNVPITNVPTTNVTTQNVTVQI